MAALLTGLLTTIALATAHESGLSEAKAYDDTEAYKVYSAILPNEWSWSEANATTLVIRTETEPCAMCIAPDKESGKVVGTAIADYKKKNGTRWLLQREFDIRKPYEMVSKEEIDNIFNLEGAAGGRPSTNGTRILAGGSNFQPWDSIRRRLSQSCTQATPAGGLCGGGTFHILQKVDGKWVSLRLKGGTSCAWAS